MPPPPNDHQTASQPASARAAVLAPLAALVLAAATVSCATAPARPSRVGEAAGPVLAAGGMDAQPQAVLSRFAEAVRAGRFDEAWPLLSARWRARLTPAQLGSDWLGAGPLAREAADRVVALLAAGAPVEAAQGQASFRTLAAGPGRAARLVEEPGGWRVDALE